MSLMAANEESDPSAILNGFWVTLFSFVEQTCLKIAYLMDESKKRYPLRYSSAFFLRRFWYVRRTTSTLA